MIDPIDRFERLTLLGGVPLFSGLDVDELESIAEVTSLRAHDPGETVFTQGETGAEMLVIVEGSVDVVHRSRDAARSLATLAPGAVVGELAIFRGSPQAADVVAGDDGFVGLVIDADTLDRILQERPQIALALLAALAEKLAVASTT